MRKDTQKDYPLIDALVVERSTWLDMALVSAFAILTAFCSQLSFWIGPVPITGQTFAVLMSGAVLGSRRGALAQLSYIAVGATGLPFWFAAGGTLGMARIMGPTGGYLVGFVAAAFIVGWLCERGWDRRISTAVLAMICGSACLYIFGLSWLVNFTGMGSVLSAGLYPFMVGDIIKITLASVALPAACKWLK